MPSQLARTAPPHTRSPPDVSDPGAPCVPRVAVSPPASFPPRLTTTQLPSACGWCHQPPQGTFTPESLVMSGVLGIAAGLLGLRLLPETHGAPERLDLRGVTLVTAGVVAL